jgi:hypothetical protein
MPLGPLGAVWKRSTSAWRASAFAMLPSMRQKAHPRAFTAAWGGATAAHIHTQATGGVTHHMSQDKTLALHTACGHTYACS